MAGWGEVDPILRKLLQDLFEADGRGARRERLARAHGYADGYMRALIDLGLVTEKQLLDIVLQERARAAQKPLPRVRSPHTRPLRQPVPAVLPSMG
jgi:hypothetical protein